MTKNLDLSLYNNSDSLLKADISENRTQPLFQKNTEFSVGITRLNIPISSSEKIIIDDDNIDDYKLSINVNIVFDTTNPIYTIKGTSYLSKSNIFPMYNAEDFIENVNATFFKCYKNIVDTNVQINTDFRRSAGLINHNFTNASSSANIVIPSFTNPVTKTMYVELVIDNVSFVRTGGEQPISSVYLTSPNGVRCCIFNNIDISSIPSGHRVYFENGSPHNQGKVINVFENYVNNELYYQPKESFLKFEDSTPNGTWILSLEAVGKHYLNVTLSADLRVYAQVHKTNNFSLPVIPPNLSLTDGGYFNLSVHELFLLNNMVIDCGKHLKKILQLQSYSASSHIEFPIFSLSANVDKIQTFKQESPRLFAMCTLERIEISLPNLPIERDSSSGNTITLANTSYMLPPDEVLNFDYITYNSDAGVHPWRIYKLNANNPIFEILISVSLKYRNGKTKALYIEPRESMNILLSFFQNT